MKKLSGKQGRILDYLAQFLEERGYPPTVRDIAQGCQISSTSVVDYNLHVLEREGYIRRDREVSRGIELLGREQRPRHVGVPLLGYIAAGEPIPLPGADLQPLDTLELTDEILGGRRGVYALQVRGSSLEDALIHDGDIVLLEPAATARDGDLVALWLKRENETALKKLYKEGGQIRLQPANSRMKPIYVDPQAVEVQGRVVGVIRRLS